MHTKILTTLLGTLLGIIVGLYTQYGTEVSIVAIGIGIIQVALYTSQAKNRIPTHPHARSISLLSGIFFCTIALGIIRVQFIEEPRTLVCEQACQIEGVIISPPKVQDAYQIFVFSKKDTEDFFYDIQVHAPLYPRYEAGDTLTLFGKVNAPHVRMSHTNVRTFNYTSYLHLHTIGSEMIYPKIEVRKHATSTGETFSSSLTHIRISMVSHIDEYVSAPSASLASGMLFGSTSMSKELLQTFRIAGLSHIIVLSGFNIVILISAVLLVLFFVPLVLRVFFAAAFVLLFVLMVGAEASVIRATGMAIIALLALLLGRAYTARHALLISLLCIVIYQPTHLIDDVSLHLSFLATAGIVYMSDTIKSFLTTISSDVYKEIITTSISAYLATVPYVMYTFGTVSIYALLTNLIVLPLVPMMMLITFLVVVTASFSSTLASLLGYIDTQLGTFIIFVAETVEGLPLSSTIVTISFVTMCVMYVILGVVYHYMKKIMDRNISDETRARKDDFLESEIIHY